MKRIIALILTAVTIFSLAACSADDGVPEGMQLVRGGEEVGYYFYAPEEWTVSNQGQISAAYASNVDTSSVTYVELPMPETTVEEYFSESLKEFPKAPTVTVSAEETTFGNADNALVYIFEHEYSGHNFRTMQIFVKYRDRFGIFTFNSPLENISSDEVVQFDYYREKINDVIKNFKFTDKTENTKKDEYETDEDGYRLVSDKSIAKFSLYLPEEFTVNYASGMVSAELADGSNINMTRATATNVWVNEYWKTRKEELSAITTDINVIREDEPTKFANAKNAFAYEYTYVYNGETYHVYQVLSVTSFNGFVFTYTAKDANYDLHLELIKTIIEKVEL